MTVIWVLLAWPVGAFLLAVLFGRFARAADRRSDFPAVAALPAAAVALPAQRAAAHEAVGQPASL